MSTDQRASRSCPQCGGPRKTIEARQLIDGRIRYRMECAPCRQRETFCTATPMPRIRRGPAASAASKVLALLRSHPGAKSSELAALYGVHRDRMFKHLQALMDAGAVIQKMGSLSVGYYWHIDHAPRAESWVKTVAPPAPVPKPPPYVGQMATAKTGEMQPGRVEWREIDGRQVRVTIGPTVVCPQHTMPPPVSRARVNLTTDWGSL
jgi:hypothetical protein